MNDERGPAEAGPLSVYLAELEPSVSQLLGSIVARALALVPDAAEGRTYGMPGLVYRGRPLLSIRQTAAHLGYYPFSPAVVDEVATSLDGFSLSKGTVRFTVDRPLPVAVVERMILARRDEIDTALGR